MSIKFKFWFSWSGVPFFGNMFSIGTICPLLNFEPYFPLLSYFLVIVFKPYQVFSVAPVGRKDFFCNKWNLTLWHVFFYVPIYCIINYTVFKPTSVDFTNLFFDVFKFFKIWNEFNFFTVILFDWFYITWKRLRIINNSFKFIFTSRRWRSKHTLGFKCTH